MYLAQLRDDELLRHAHLEINDLTSTPLEIELLRRLELRAAANPLVEALETEGLDADLPADVDKVSDALRLISEWPQAKLLLAVLNDFDLDNDEVLRARLLRLRKFDDVLEDLTEPLQNLSSLTEPLQALSALASETTT